MVTIFYSYFSSLSRARSFKWLPCSRCPCQPLFESPTVASSVCSKEQPTIEAAKNKWKLILQSRAVRGVRRQSPEAESPPPKTPPPLEQRRQGSSTSLVAQQDDQPVKLLNMFSKGRSGAKLLENNPILQFYEVGRAYASGGPEGIWKIHEAVSKTDGKVRRKSHFGCDV